MTNNLNRNQSQQQRIEIIDNMVYEYNRNIRDYQQNISGFIQMINNIHPTRQPPATRQSQSLGQSQPLGQSLPTRQHPATRQSQPLWQSQPLGQSQPFFNHEIFSYFTQPFTNTTTLDSSNNITTAQINISTETIIFNENIINLQEDEIRCPITMDTFIEGDELLKIRGCGHKFKKHALMNWLTRSSKCPLCRYDLNTYYDISNNSVESLVNNPYISQDPITQDPITQEPIAETIPETPSVRNSPRPSTSTRPTPARHQWSSIINNTLNQPEFRNGMDFIEDATNDNLQMMQNFSQIFSGMMQNNMDNADMMYTFEIPLNNRHYDGSMNRI